MRKNRHWQSVTPLSGFLALGFLALAILVLSSRALRSDVAMYLTAGRLILAGWIPYVDFTDTNPPLIQYLGAIAAGLERVSGFDAISIWRAGTLLLTALAMQLSVTLSDGMGSKMLSRAWALGIIFEGFLIQAQGEFGQREQLFTLSFVPYLLFRWRSAEKDLARQSRAVATFLGAACGVFSCLKPQFVFMVVALELCLVFSRRKFRPDRAFWSFTGALGAYALHFLFIPQGMSAALWGDAVPLLLRHAGEGFGVFRQPFWRESLGSALLLLGCFFVMTVLALRDPKKKHASLSLALSVCGSISVLAALLQGRNLPYYWIPPRQLLVLALFIQMDAKKAVVGWVAAAGAALVALEVAPVAIQLFRFDAPFPGRLPPRTSMEAIRWFLCGRTTPGDRVAIFSPNSNFSYPDITRCGLWPATRYLHLFPMALFHPSNQTRAEFMRVPGDDEKVFVERVRQDLNQAPPRILVFPSLEFRSSFLPEGFNTFDYALRTGMLGGILSQYRLAHEEPGLKIFEKK